MKFQTAIPAPTPVVQPPAQTNQQERKQTLQAALNEIEELKQTLRYVEISLAKSKEECETTKQQMNQAEDEKEKLEGDLKQCKQQQSESAFEVELLQKKIANFAKSQADAGSKGKVKASNYMSEIIEKDKELQKSKLQLVDFEEELKQLSNLKEKFLRERNHLLAEMKGYETEIAQLKDQTSQQKRLILNVYGHNKNQAAVLNNTRAGGNSSTEQIGEESSRNERIAKQMNRGAFMPLGENPPKMYSEQEHPLLKASQTSQMNAMFAEKNRDYLNDDLIPPTIYALIEEYRNKARVTGPGNDLALLIDDFFSEANAILKDAQLREIARIRNENAVEVTKLKKALNEKAPTQNYGLIAKENLNANKAMASMMADNEVERQRRQLIEENESIKAQLRAAEALLKSGTQERVKFMEGASWIAKKATSESDHHADKVMTLVKEFEARTRSSLVDERINEYDGRRVAANKAWLASELQVESNDMKSRFDHMLENVNYQLSQALKQFK